MLGEDPEIRGGGEGISLRVVQLRRSRERRRGGSVGRTGMEPTAAKQQAGLLDRLRGVNSWESA